MAHQMNPQMKQCIEACLNCYQTCLHDAMNHCLETGGKHLEPKHFRLMIDCAEVCRTAAHVMLSGSDQHQRICAACADICEACARSCEQVGDMDECVQACRKCAESCRQMAAPGSSRGLTGSTSQTNAKAPM